MYNFKFFVSVGVVVVFIFPTHNEVTAAPAPAPHPCLLLLDGHGRNHGHPEPTTTTTAKPGAVEDFAKLRSRKTNQLEKLITDWMLRGPSNEVQKPPRSRNALDRMISGYMKFLSSILNMF